MISPNKGTASIHPDFVDHVHLDLSHLLIAGRGLLYVGSLHRGPLLDDREAHAYVGLVDVVVLLCEPRIPWEQTRSLRVARFRFADGPGSMSAEDEQSISLAASYTEADVRAGKRVAVLCRRGLNRSGLVAGLVIRSLVPSMPPEAIVESLRGARGPSCLSNPHFVRHLGGGSARTRSGVLTKNW